LTNGDHGLILLAYANKYARRTMIDALVHGKALKIKGLPQKINNN